HGDIGALALLEEAPGEPGEIVQRRQLRVIDQRLAGLLGVRPKETRLIVERVLDSYARLPAEAPPAETQPAGFDSGRETSPGAVLRVLPARMPALRRLDDLARLGIP
ncbi:hypothetical protein, partial [Salmonella sp. SAL04269]|uniref:hypothetical protein n=1 Tax=Salmonella sp. SAL04269 TaxID=3159847 RepID=UPI00397C5EFF